MAKNPVTVIVLLQLCVVFIPPQLLHANPVSSPELSSKNIKTLVNDQSSKPVNTQDAHLNSLTAYATNYDNLPPNILSGSGVSQNFKPSYKVPQMETNFTPMQSAPSGSGVSAAPTPVIMQYIPQSMNDGGNVQYLQLIPTRPLIVPISAFLPSPANGGAQGAAGPYHPQFISGNAGNAIVEYTARGPTVLASMPANAAGQTSALIDLPGGLPYGLQTYANTIQPYRNNYRINREIKGKHLGATGLTLNLNEYIPATRDTIHPIYIRGRP